MLEAYEITHLHEGDQSLEVVLTYDERKKSRHKTKTTCGKELGWFVERGIVLAQNDILKCQDGTLIKVKAAEEHVSDVTCEDPLTLMKAVYHLGNRHVPLQVEKAYLRYQKDHVLDEMVEGLGLKVTHTNQPFNPESGAYSNGGHSHGHHHHH